MTRALRWTFFLLGAAGCTGVIAPDDRAPSPGGHPVEAPGVSPTGSGASPPASPASPAPPAPPGAPAPSPAAPAPVDTPREPPPTLPPLTCDGAGAGAAPRRLWRLTASQYLNTIAVFLSKRPTSFASAPAAPRTLTSPIDASSTAERFRNFASAYGLSDFEVRRGINLSAEAAATLVATLRKSPTSCLGAATRPPFETCLKSVVEERGALLFSRPLTAAETAEYVSLGTAAVATVGEDDAAALALEGMLMAPSFLFRSELGDGQPDARGLVRLTPYETAAALSYTLVDGPPDAELWRAASTGQLSTPEQVRAQAARLLGTLSAKSTTVLRFLREYLEYDAAKLVFKDVPGYDPPALVRDTELLVSDVVAGNAPGGLLRALLTTSSGYHHRYTAMHYETKSTSYTPEKVELPAAQRAGILTQPSFLVGFSDTNENMPVKRGRFVAESLLCQSIPDLPIDVLPVIPEDPTRTLRERLKLHSADPSCAVCHRLMDPLGLAFEAYDHLGRPRTMEVGKPVDAAGVLAGAGAQDGPFANAVQLMQRLAESPVVEQCFVRHSFRYWMGRNEQAWDGCTLATAQDAYRKANGDYRELVLALVASPSFLTRSVR